MLGYAQASCFEISARVLDTGVVFQDPEFALFFSPPVVNKEERGIWL